MDPDRHDYWQFSWDEMARYDLPAMLYYVLRHTGRRKVGWRGSICLLLINLSGKLKSIL